MQDEVRELLKLCGLPYIDAPAEAESQCAVLTELGLCEAVISDDSDSMVFGSAQVSNSFILLKRMDQLIPSNLANLIYSFIFDDDSFQVLRRFFSSRSTVELYDLDEIYNKIGLNRDMLILMSFLLGTNIALYMTLNLYNTI